MIKIFNNNITLKLFILFSWSILWLSINSMPGEIEYMKYNFISFINGSRTILAIIVSFLSIIILFISLKNKKIKKTSIILTLFLLYFIFQIFGLIATERPFDIHRTYLIIYAIGVISIFFLIYYNDLNEILPYLWIISLSIIFFAYSITTVSSPQSIIDVLTRGNLYWLFHPDVAIFDQAPPRITGLTRALGLLSIFILVLLFYIQKINLISLILVLFLFCFSTLIWMGQSRGSLLCFYLSIFIMIFFLINLNFIKKFFILVIVIILPILISNIITNLILENNFIETKNLDNNDNNDNNFKQNSRKKIEKFKITKLFSPNETPRVIINEGGTSGRTELWKISFERFKKNKIFGYGPQADRYLLEDDSNKYGNNVSNTIIYSFLSGGYFSLTTMIAIFSYTLYLISKFIKNNKILTKKITISKKNIFILLALIYIIFFGVRSFFENSFGLFSIDYMLVILSLFTLESKIFKNS